MQPVSQDVDNDVLSPSTLARAIDAYICGDLDACLTLLDNAQSNDAAEHRESLLLRARVGLRRMRYTDVIALLRPALALFVGIDEACTAQMLHAIAVARSGRPKRGLALLARLSGAARTLRPHPTIRAEIAYWYAFAHWLVRDYDGTLRHARAAEAANADVVSVRAATLRGYVANAKERYPEALALFRSARDKYRLCRERDADLRDRIKMQIATLEVALYSSTKAPTRLNEDMRLPEERPAKTKSILGAQIASMDAWLHAFEGNKRWAYYHARVSEDLATTDGWRVWALANRAQIALAFSDADLAYTFASEALEIADGVAWMETTDEERVALLLLAEALATTDPQAAVSVLHRYEALTTRIDCALLFQDDVRLWVLETFVRGLTYRIQGDTTKASQAFHAVYKEAARVGILWRATLALIELDTTETIGAPRIDRRLQAAELLVRKHFSTSFLSRRLGWWRHAFDDGVARKLSPRQREVLRHFLGARNTKEMALLMGLSEYTVKEYTSTLFRCFGVRSKEELLVACYERGIGSPAWWDALEHIERPLR